MKRAKERRNGENVREDEGKDERLYEEKEKKEGVKCDRKGEEEEEK